MAAGVLGHNRVRGQWVGIWNTSCKGHGDGQWWAGWARAAQSGLRTFQGEWLCCHGDKAAQGCQGSSGTPQCELAGSKCVWKWWAKRKVRDICNATWVLVPPRCSTKLSVGPILCRTHDTRHPGTICGVTMASGWQLLVYLCTDTGATE